jgi:hypothetical protein
MKVLLHRNQYCLKQKSLCMKKTITLFFLGMAATAVSIAQPVITSGITSVPLGTVDSAYGASPTVLPGSAGHFSICRHIPYGYFLCQGRGRYYII